VVKTVFHTLAAVNTTTFTHTAVNAAFSTHVAVNAAFFAFERSKSLSSAASRFQAQQMRSDTSILPH
jgi:hypothetical protein